MSSFYVYMLKCKSKIHEKTYVGYTQNLTKRIKLHNTNKGAKSTRGYKCKLIYKKTFKIKSNAIKFEYELKNDKKLRNIIKSKYA